MAWAVPKNDRAKVNNAGRILLFGGAKIDEYSDALAVINNWRASHAFPLNTFQMNLRRKGKSLDDDCLVAQRIKRLSSISHELDRFPSMKLSQMPDIGSCRAIVKDVQTVRRLVTEFLSSDVKHRLSTKEDYIDQPNNSGYRGVHLVYRYFSDRKDTYNDLKIDFRFDRNFSIHGRLPWRSLERLFSRP